LHGGNLMTPWRVFSARVNVSRIDFSPFACILNSLLSPLSLRCFLAFLPQQKEGGGWAEKGAGPGDSIRSKLAK